MEEIKFEDVEWLFMEAGFLKPEASINAVLKIKNVNPELEYIQRIIKNDYPFRDKLVLLCGYIEPYIYSQVGFDSNGNIKNDIDKKVDKSNKLDMNDYYLLMIYLIITIIFKNFNNNLIPDKRIPHRNCILHKGILSYTDVEIELAYYTLVAYIYLIYDYSIKITKQNKLDTII
jgi:hypothetical protein